MGPEDNPNAMRDYWLHMEMFKYFHKKFPTLKYSMHAGELSVGIVPPEDLSWHINSALFDAEANRIGHGVDIPYETDCYALLEHMKEKKVPVEINMLSNEFILGIKNELTTKCVGRHQGQCETEDCYALGDYYVFLHLCRFFRFIYAR